MSLEAKLEANTEALNRNSDLLEKMIARAEAVAGSAPKASAAADEKPKAARAKKETAETDGTAAGTETAAVTIEDVKSKAGAWLGEFKADANDPETEARKGAIKAALAKLTKKDGATLADVPVADLPRVLTWLEKKQVEDAGFGIGRLTAKPGAAKEVAAEEDDI